MYVPPKHAPGVTVVDFSDHTLPKFRVGSRVADAPHGQYVDDILRDTPDDLRPPSLIAFHAAERPECASAYAALDFEGRSERELPARERLFIAQYDVDYAHRRAWYVFTPEMDLEARYNVSACPAIVFVPRKCDGFTEWCVESRDGPNSIAGCADFKEQCSGVEQWDGSGDWVAWAKERIEREGEPKISHFMESYAKQGQWIQSRQRTTSMTYERNMYLSPAFPAFTATGFKAVQTPKEVQDWLVGFAKRTNDKGRRRTEQWAAESTQMSFHEKPTTFLDMDLERSAANHLANTYIKPLVEEWSGIPDLELTSFYGIREYEEDAWLRGHIDRIDTHVLSVTISIQKLDDEGNDLDPESRDPWPLQGIGYDGRVMRYDHPAGSMVLYESSKVVHGRPYRNKSGRHVAAFCHFKPTHSAQQMDDWAEVLKKARHNMNINVARAAFRSMPSVEPENPVYTKVEYGHGSSGNYGAQSGGAKKKVAAAAKVPDGQVPCKFINKSGKPVTLFWEGPDGPVFQSSAGPGLSFTYQSFVGHSFFWAEGSKPRRDEDAKPMRFGSFKIRSGVREYPSPVPVNTVKSENPRGGGWSIF